MTKFVCISDTHNEHAGLTTPPCDVLIHSGDATIRGSIMETLNFLDWFAAQPAMHKLFVPGNHDAIFEDAPAWSREECDNRDIELLIDQTVTIGGIKIHGTPYMPRYFDWSFMKADGALQLHWDLIPLDTAMLITHCPPYGILDADHRGALCGSQTLMKAVLNLPMLTHHVFGHMHSQPSQTYVMDKLTFINAAIKEDRYTVDGRNPVEIIL